MKNIIMLTVLMATLLLLAGVAFASPQDCHCYEVTYNDWNSDNSFTREVTICFDYGWFSGICDTSGNLSLFFDSMNLRAITQNSSTVDASLKFHGDYQHVVNGIVYCNNDTSQWKIKGNMIYDGSCN